MSLGRIGVLALATTLLLGCGSQAAKSPAVSMPPLPSGWTEQWGPNREFRIGVPLGFEVQTPMTGYLFQAASPSEGMIFIRSEYAPDLNKWIADEIRRKALGSGVDLRFKNVVLPGGAALTATFGLLDWDVTTEYIFPVPGGILEVTFGDLSHTSAPPEPAAIWPSIAETFFPAPGYSVPQPPATASPSATSGATLPAGSASPAPSAAASGSSVTITAQNIAFTQATVWAPADTPLTVRLDNQDAQIPHGIEITDAGGNVVYKGDIVTGIKSADGQAPALPAGTYNFHCYIHPNMQGTLLVSSATPAPTDPAVTPVPTPTPTPKPTPAPNAFKTLSDDAWSALLIAPDDHRGRAVKVWTCVADLNFTTAFVGFINNNSAPGTGPYSWRGFLFAGPDVKARISVGDVLLANTVVEGGYPAPYDGRQIPGFSVITFVKKGTCDPAKW